MGLQRVEHNICNGQGHPWVQLKDWRDTLWAELTLLPGGLDVGSEMQGRVKHEKLAHIVKQFCPNLQSN